MKKVIFVLILNLIVGLGVFAQDKQFFIDKPSAWVEAIEYDTNFHLYKNNTDNGATYLLLDYQEDVALEEFYGHSVIKIEEKTGIDSYSDIWINYDPSYQKLIFHKLLVHRNGNRINKLRKKDFKIIQSETDIERKIYSGGYSAGIFLEDIQIGDIIEYAYTVKGYNSVFNGNYFSTYNLEYGTPISKLFLRVRYPESRKINYKLVKTEHEPKKTINGNQVDLTWELDNVAEVVSNTDVPKWYIAYGFVQFSEFSTWEELREWSQLLYPKITIENSKLELKIQELTADLSSTEEKINALVRFVQDDIRYVGIVVNVNSHKPHHPLETFNKRFGDCKDKSYLLVTMLNHLGVDAWVSYVNTNLTFKISEYLPSPNVFDHAIVAIKHNNKLNIVDPTIANQRGDYAKSFNGDYKKAFVISDSYKEPIAISSFSTEKIIINEKYEIFDSITPVKYSVNSIYYGSEADGMRANFKRQTQKKLESSYLNFYSYLYPQMRIDGEIEFEDNEEKNNIRVRENYLIDNFWTFNNSPEINDYVSIISATNLRYYLNVPDQRNRTTPFRIYHPIEIENTIEIKNEKVFVIKDEKGEINNPCFNFSYDVDYDGNRVSINYKYKTLKDFVSVEELNQYFIDIDKVATVVWNEYTYGDENTPKTINWLLLSLVLFLLIFLSSIARKFYLRDLKDISTAPPLPIGGWLILPTIAVVITPFVLLYTVYIAEYFDLATWEFISSPSSVGYNTMWTITFVSEMVMNFILIVFSVLLLILLIERRSIFPIHFICFCLLNLLFIIVNYVMVAQIESDYMDLSGTTSVDITKTVLKAGIWVPYMLLSKRVKNTFVRVRRK